MPLECYYTRFSISMLAIPIMNIITYYVVDWAKDGENVSKDSKTHYGYIQLILYWLLYIGYPILVFVREKATVDSPPDEQVVWLKAMLCRLLKENKSAKLRAAVLEQEVAELRQALADKKEQENATLQVLMRVEQEEKVTEDDHPFVGHDAATQRYVVQLLQENSARTMDSISQMEQTAVMAESTLKAFGCVKEVLPSALDSTSEPPPLFDGTTRLYICCKSPFAQRAWIARNYKGLQDEIKLIPINLENRPTWYKEKVYAENKVPSLEHNNKIIGESLDLLEYIDSNFEGPALLSNDPAKRQFAGELLSYTDTLNMIVCSSFKGDPVTETGSAFDYLDSALHKFNDGPFFLGQFSLVDMAYAPFIERFQLFLQDVWKYDITLERPKLAAWIEELNKINAYTQTKYDPEELVKLYKKKYLAQQ